MPAPAECQLPPRHFVKLPNGRGVAVKCAELKSYTFAGTCAVLSLALLAAHVMTRPKPPQDDDDTETRRVVVPAWLCLVPLAFGIVSVLTATSTAAAVFDAEELGMTTSDMNKAAYLNYRVGEDRSKFSATAGSAGTALIAAAALLGPFLRADR